MPIHPRSSARSADPEFGSRRMLGARSPARSGLVVETFEYVAASPDHALLRVVAAFPLRRPPELSAPRLVVDAGVRSLRAPALADPAGWVLRPPDEHAYWRLGFVVPLEIARDGGVAYALAAAPGTLIALPTPTELLLAELLLVHLRIVGKSLDDSVHAQDTSMRLVDNRY